MARTTLNQAFPNGQLPPTQKQVNYIRDLGYEGEIEDREHASRLLNSYLRHFTWDATHSICRDLDARLDFLVRETP